MTCVVNLAQDKAHLGLTDSSWLPRFSGGVYMTRDSAATASVEFETTGEITSLGAVGEELNRQVRGKPMLVYNAGQVLLVRDAARGWRVTGFKPAEFGDGR